MCLGIPGKIVEVYEVAGLKMGRVDFGGVIKEACLAYIPDVEVGEYTIVHVGFALNRIDEEEARETLELLSEAGILDDELGQPAEPGEV
jgi:hydrogenase expression/formation protein HypC